MRNASAEERIGKRNRRVGELFDRIDQGWLCKGLENGAITEIRIRAATEEQPEVLLILKATSEQGKHVAFTGGLTTVQALLTWRAKEQTTGLKWREDTPWQER